MNGSSQAPDPALGVALRKAIADCALAEAAPPEEPETIAQRRRRGARRRESRLARVSLVRSDGELRWVYQRPPRAVGPRRARRAAAELLASGDVVDSFEFNQVPPNQVAKALMDLDLRLTPSRGLRSWQDGKATPATAGVPAKRTLLLVHGTFSTGDMFFDALGATAEGRTFLKRAATRYDHVLTFDHPTLSVSPILNAFDLARALGGWKGTLDVVCHSRGGLVTAWWLRTGAPNVGRVVFVGSPLEGTSLAAPARLRGTLNGLANVADAVQMAARAVGGFVPPIEPLLAVGAGLTKIFGGILTLGAKTPILDAAIAIVPGLAAQSKVQHNQELERLHQMPWPTKAQCFAITSDFEPGQPDAPWWRFWKRWGSPAAVVANLAADRVFGGANDLVVDVDTMSRLAGTVFPEGNCKRFGRNPLVHHLNYFAQPDSVQFLTDSLAL